MLYFSIFVSIFLRYFLRLIQTKNKNGAPWNFSQTWRNDFTTHLIRLFWKDTTSVMSECLSTGDRILRRLRNEDLLGTGSLSWTVCAVSPRRRDDCTRATRLTRQIERHPEAPPCCFILRCIISRKLSIDQFTLFNCCHT